MNLEKSLSVEAQIILQHPLKIISGVCMQASQQDGDITTENVTIGVVGSDQPFTVLEGNMLQPFVSQLDSDQPADAPADDGAAPMES